MSNNIAQFEATLDAARAGSPFAPPFHCTHCGYSTSNYTDCFCPRCGHGDEEQAEAQFHWRHPAESNAMFDAIVDQYEVREHVEETIARNKAAPGQLRSEWAVQMGPHVGAPPAARERGTDSGGGSGSGKGGNNDSNGPHRVFNHFHSYGGRGMGPGGQW